MEVIANGFMTLVFSTAMVAVLAGAVGGAIVWRVGIGVAWGGLATVGVYLLAAVASLGFSWPKVILHYGIPAVIMTFLTSYLAARFLGRRTGLRPLWSTLSALLSSLAAGTTCLFVFDPWTPIWRRGRPWPIPLGADACLILLAIRDWKLIPR